MRMLGQGLGRAGGGAIAATIAIIPALLVPAQSPAGEGDLDPSFGQRGYAEVPALQTSAVVRSRADGSIVVAGTDGNGDVRLVGLEPDGTRDEGFGIHGIVDPPYPQEAVKDLVVAPNGNTILLTSGEQGAHLDRFTPSGAPETTFGVGGVVTIDHALNGLELDSQRRLVVFGPDGVFRRTQTGAADGSFGNGGEVDLQLVAAVTDTQDRVLVADRIASGSLRYFRLDANGVYDPSFPVLPADYGIRRLVADGADGAWSTYRSCGGRGGCYSSLIHVLSDGTYGPGFGNDFYPRGPVVAAVAGEVTTGGGARYSAPYAPYTAAFVHGLTPDTTDTGFGFEGHAFLYPGGEPVFGSAIAIEGDGRTLISTSRYKEIGDGVLVARLLAESPGANADADPVSDAKDRCPAIPGPRDGRGCRTLEGRKITIGKEGIRPHGRVSGLRACTSSVDVRILRLRRHREPKRVIALSTDYRGNWLSPHNVRPGRYQAVTKRTYGHGSGLCPAVHSKIVTLGK